MKARTVLGDLDATELGITLPHEHLHNDARFLCTNKTRPEIPMEEIPPDELRVAPMSWLANLEMQDEEVAADELEKYLTAGGKTIVDLTPRRIARDWGVISRLAVRTGANIIMSTGYYVQASHPPELERLSIDEIAAQFVEELEVGVDGGPVRAGVIGEIGTGDPFTPGEERVIRAAARAQLQTGAPINVHCAAGGTQVFRILDAIQDEGQDDLSRVVLSHMDVAVDIERDVAIAERGAFVEYDTFGHENYPDSRGYQMPSDQERVAAVAQLLDRGIGDRLLLSHDVCFRHLWTRYGGYGYANLLTRVTSLMSDAGISAADRERLFVHNPAQVFAYLA